jgi:hypothetical protein
VCTGLSGKPSLPRANGRLRYQRATRGRANGHKAAPDCPVCTGQCPVRQGDQGLNGRLHKERKGIAHCLCPVVHHPTEGKNCLPNGDPTVPSYLGAIKGTPRRMEHYTKPPLNILRRLDSTTTQSDHRV